MTAAQAIRSAHADGYDALDAPRVLVDALANLPRLARVAGWTPVLRAFVHGLQARHAKPLSANKAAV